MSSTESLTSAPLKRGTYAPSTATDLRSPCPLINCLANHGYLPRDGREVRAGELTAAMNEVGLSTALGAVFSNPIFLEHRAAGRNLAEATATGEAEQQQQQQQQQAKKDNATQPQQPRSFLSRMWYLLCNPWAVLFSAFGMRRAGQKDGAGKKCLNLDQLALPGVVEHDISLTRRDHAQGDNVSRQPDLVRELLAASSDGGRSLSAADLAGLRRRRIQQQRRDNPGLVYGAFQHQIACAEIALILDVFGDGERLPCDYARAFFLEERLPVNEGWTRRRWWTLGFFELGKTVAKVKQLIGTDL